MFICACVLPKAGGTPRGFKEQGNKAYFATEGLENKGTCRFREQGKLKYVLATKEQRETFEVNTGAETPSETLKEDIRTTQMFFFKFYV